MTVESEIAAKTILENIAQGGVSSGERDQAIAEVAHGRDTEGLAERSTGSAVVRDADDGSGGDTIVTGAIGISIAELL